MTGAKRNLSGKELLSLPKEKENKLFKSSTVQELEVIYTPMIKVLLESVEGTEAIKNKLQLYLQEILPFAITKFRQESRKYKFSTYFMYYFSNAVNILIEKGVLSKRV